MCRPSPVQVLSLGGCPLRANVGGRSEYLDRQLAPVTKPVDVQASAFDFVVGGEVLRLVAFFKNPVRVFKKGAGGAYDRVKRWRLHTVCSGSVPDTTPRWSASFSNRVQKN